jgi:hypothetical protein
MALPVTVSLTFTGTVNGTNLIFSSNIAPDPAASAMVWDGGVLQVQGTDYTVSGNTFTFLAGHAPTVGLTGTANIDPGTFVNIASLTEQRSISNPDPDTLYYLSELGKQGFFYYDAADTTSADNTGLVVVSGSYRFKRVYNNDIVYASWFGAAGNGVSDDTTAIQAAINACPFGGIVRMQTNGVYKITSSILIPYGVSVDGFSAQIVPATGGTFISGYIFLINTINGTTWTVSNPKMADFFVKGFHLNNSPNNVASMHGIRCHAPYHISFIRGERLGRHVSISNEYIDFAYISNIDILLKQDATAYAIETGNLGDARVVDKIHMAFPSSASTALSVLTGNGLNGCTISNIINGNIFMGKSGNQKLYNVHQEAYGSITINASCCILENIYHWVKPGTIPITINADTYEMSPVILNHVLFMYLKDETYTTEQADIAANTKANLKFNGVYRSIFGTNINFRIYTGARLNINGIPYAMYNKSNKNLSVSCDIIDGSFSGQNQRKLPTTSTNIITNIATDGNMIWKAASGTYYFTAQFLADPVRMIGRNDDATEKSIAATNGGNAVLLLGGGSSGIERSDCNIRYYRGTATGSYNMYVDAGVLSTAVIDAGLHVVGNVWQSRTAGGVDTLFLAEKILEDSSGSVTCWATATPTVGTWSKNDKIINTNPSSGNPYMWICTTGGSPGTWTAVTLN